MSISEWAGGQVFKVVHGHNLVYNTCWEDPRLDHQALKLTADDTILVITSAGCNALDYALAGPRQVVAVDMNPRQNALLDLKLAGIRNLQYEDFFAMFGEGRLPGATKIYEEKLRPALSEWPQRYWDRWIKFFDPQNRRPFYFRGTCGTFAMLINVYINRVAKLRPQINDLLDCATVAQQQEIYDRYLRAAFLVQVDAFRHAPRYDPLAAGGPAGPAAPDRNPVPGRNQPVPPGLRRGGFRPPAAERQLFLAGLHDGPLYAGVLSGVPQARELPEASRRAGRSRADAYRFSGRLFDEGPAADFALRAPGPHGLAIDAAAAAVGAGVASDRPPGGAGARILWRSAGLRTEFVDRAQIVVEGKPRAVGELLTYDRPLAEELHSQCRVHTYGSFHIANLAA